MSAVFGVVLALILLTGVPYGVRMFRGPTVFDRIVGLNGLGTKVPVILVIVGMMYDRVDMYVDLALALFLLNLFTTLLVAKYVREKGGIKG